MRITIRALLALALVALSTFVGPVSAATNAVTTVAQATQSNVVGTISDPAGKPLPGANVTISGSGVNKTVTSDANGGYAFAVSPGVYTITVNRGGFQTATTEVTVAGSETETVNASLTASTLSNLGTIGRTSTTASANQALTFNISSSSQGSISTAVIQDRNQPNLNNVIMEIPGVTVNHSSSNPNTSFYIRGSDLEAKTFLDGHVIANSTSGATLTLFFSSKVFGGVDVTKGAGIGSPTAGYSGIGYANARTLDFTPKNSGYANIGIDQYGGTQYDLIVDHNFFNNKLQVILGKSFEGYLGPTNNYTGNVYGAIGSAGVTNALGLGAAGNVSSEFNVPNYGYSANSYNNVTLGWQGDMSDTYGLAAYLGKIRYNFTSTTSVTGSFLGLYGVYEPQGGEYAQYVGQTLVPACLSAAKVPLTQAQCLANTANTNLYNNPSAANLIGQTVPTYTFYPGSSVIFDQPFYDLDFKTAIGNDTLLLRPYSAVYQRTINGQNEDQQFGYSGNIYQVTSNAQCQVISVAPTATAQAKGPCLAANSPAYALPYVGTSTTPTAFPTGSLPAGYTCSALTPCYVSTTQVTNTGAYGFTAPYTTQEKDNLMGYTATYIHPFGANTVSASFDHYYDQGTTLINDASPFAAGCTPTLGGGTLPTTQISYGGQLIGAQPNCTAYGTNVSRPTPISVPPTLSSVSSASITAQIAVTPKLEFDIGNYFTYYTINAQIEDPNLLSAYAAAFGSTASAPVALVGANDSGAHYDPHFGLIFRPTRDLVLRGTAGSSITIPYAAQVSGLGSIALSGTGAAQTATVNNVNSNLRPENVTAYDLGGDYRFHNGLILSTDIYNDVIFNSWLQPTIASAAPAGSTLGAGGYFTTQWLNAGDQVLQGFEFQLGDEPTVGFGGKMSLSMERAYYMNLPASVLVSPISVTTGLPIITPITAYDGEQINQIPYARGYAEVRYQTSKGALLRFGADYEGNNNAYNSPAIWLFDTTLRVPLKYGINFQVSGYNIFSNTNGSYLSQGVLRQGRVQVGGTYLPGGFVYTNVSGNGSATGAGAAVVGYNGLVNPGFQTFTFSLSKKL